MGGAGLAPSSTRRGFSIGGHMKRYLVLVLFVAMLGQGALAQRAAEHWVGTWATAEVGRPQVAPAPLPSPPGQPPPATPAPFVHFSNQTFREIVRTSIPG